MYKQVSTNMNFVEREKETLKFWNDNQIFEKSMENRKEGKTLTSTMAVYLNALTNKGVHVVTVNEYLASRDASEMGELYNWLGLTVGLNLNSLSKDEKREAYAADITYSTNNELGFDYLRDNISNQLQMRANH